MEYLIFSTVIIGVGWSSYKIGLKEGGEKMIGMLEILGIIYTDENDDIHPNKLYEPSYRVKK
jgi:hypothetical protein